MNATPEELAAAFNLWKDRYQENPGAFTDAGDYGRNCANYLGELREEVRRTSGK